MKDIDSLNLKKNEKEQLIEKITALIAGEKEILFAYVHGSFAEGDNFRDIDLAVYINEMPTNEMLKYELLLEEKIESALKLPVDLKVLNNAPPPFCYMVIKKGLKVFVKDDRKRTAFEVSTLQRYFDFQPYRRRYMQEA
ncbi:MAG: nucleotidyltransferase domain-containing protein [Bacillota bacterium]|nr:nucleotidyltransferase domain-containing protein [Bacillota bacterium]